MGPTLPRVLERVAGGRVFLDGRRQAKGRPVSGPGLGEGGTCLGNLSCILTPLNSTAQWFSVLYTAQKYNMLLKHKTLNMKIHPLQSCEFTYLPEAANH